MADNTKIEWADSTANLWIGCTKLSPACDHCYAEADFDLRKHRVTWGPHGDRSYCKAGWALIAKMQRRAAKNGGVDPDLGRKRRIFVNSLSDFFDNHRSITWRADAFDLIEAAPDVIIMLVTKRPENVAKMVPAHWLSGGWPAHVWLLVTAEDQQRADHRVPILLSIPGVPVRGLSVEPLLGPVDLGKVYAIKDEGVTYLHDAPILGLDWVIVGGESGPGARPIHPDWARSLRDQCAAAAVPFFFKQWGEWGPDTGPQDRGPPSRDKVMEGTGPCAVRVGDAWQQYPDGYAAPLELCSGHGEFVYRLGKKTNGHLLDGVEHFEFPA